MSQGGRTLESETILQTYVIRSVHKILLYMCEHGAALPPSKLYRSCYGNSISQLPPLR